MLSRRGLAALCSILSSPRSCRRPILVPGPAEEKLPKCEPCLHSGYAADSGNNIWAQGKHLSPPGHRVTAWAAALPEPAQPARGSGNERTVSFHRAEHCDRL